MAETREFSTKEEMIEYICSEDEFFTIKPEDIIIGEPCGHDLRVGWYNIRTITTKRIRNTIYDPPAAIGFCTIE